MGIRIKYPDGTTEFLPTAVGEKEDEEGNLVFMDWQGNVVKVIEDEEGLQWHPSNE
jgi:hypothetical protein